MSKRTSSKPPSGPSGKNVGSGGGQRWVMRLTAMVIVPLLLIAGLEGLLRLSGYGHSTDFFFSSKVDGVKYWVPSEKFTHRFFPPAIARPIVPFRMAAEKPEGTFRIFVFGASAALGDPDPSYGMVRLLEELLDDRYPDMDFEVVCVAMTAINSHVVLPIARECARLDGDMWIIYLGNNEMVGPFGAGTVFGEKALPVGLVRAGLFIKSTRLGQLMMGLIGKIGSDAAPDQWAGIHMFKDNQLPHDDPARIRTYDHFRRNLEDILAVGRKAGVPVLLSTVGSNLRDCSPFASLHKADLDPASREQWQGAFDQGRARERAEDFGEALSSYRVAEAIDPSYAELHYRTGICLQETSQEKKALEAFHKARDYDALAVRADSRINAIIRSAAAERDAVLVDAEAAMEDEGVPGSDWFFEHVHFTPEGNYRLARLIAEHIDPLLPASVTGNRTPAWTEMRDCMDARALTTWDHLRILHGIYKRISVSPHDGQSSNAGNKAFIADWMKDIKAGGLTEQTRTEDRRLYETALARRPEDVSLIGNYAQFFDGNGMEREALAYAFRFRDLLPDTAWTHYYLALQLAHNGRYKDAEASLEQALKILPVFPRAEKGLKELRGQQ